MYVNDKPNSNGVGQYERLTYSFGRGQAQRRQKEAEKGSKYEER